jgi:GT2 family glycosyltransferase
MHGGAKILETKDGIVEPRQIQGAKLEKRYEWIELVERERAEHRSTLEKIAADLEHLERAHQQLLASPTWKLAQQLEWAAHSIAPSGTARRRLLSVGYRTLKALPKLRRRAYAAHRARACWQALRRVIVTRLGLPPFDHLGLLARRAAVRNLTQRLPRFPRVDEVDVSIVIPVYNHLPDTLACLDSIVRSRPASTYEVIVVDDASEDGTQKALTGVEGLVYLWNEKNVGFIGSCNRGAAAARGARLVFLNNDTLVSHGWLDALAATFQKVPGTGLAGAKLIYPDGRLQEAGSVIWRDASGWNYGNLDDPDHPRYNFVREVDYCSGACIMVPRALFHKLGGFDPLYAPAYYEDVDLAFKIRHAGHKVIYQPLARVIHREGLTSGRSVETGVKANQRRNQPRFRERWSTRLVAHPEPPGRPVRVVRAHGPEAGALGQVLVIDHRIPFPDQDAGSVRMVEILRAIRRRGHHVAFIPDDFRLTSPYVEELLSTGVEVIHEPYYDSVEDYLCEHGREFDLAILSRGRVASRHMTVARRLAPRAKIVFDTVDLQFLREERQAELTQEPAHFAAAALRKKQELRLAMRADRTLVVSPTEKAILEAECAGLDVQVLATVQPIEEAEVPDYEQRGDIVFIGGFGHTPNVDAVLFFAREILPRVRRRLPGAVFHVIGPEPTAEIRRLAGRYTRVHGHVPDVKPIFERARVSVAPLRFGAGVKGKLNQSMALGVPVIATSIAAEGMYLEHGVDAMIADDPEGFAEALLRAWSSRELWERLSRGGRENIREHFSVEAAQRAIDELLEWAISPAPRAGSSPVGQKAACAG